MDDKLEQLKSKKLASQQGGGESSVQKQHSKGKLTAWERINLLVDGGSFVETSAFATHRCNDFGMEQKRYEGEAVITGIGTIEGRTVAIYSQDFTIFGGSLSEVAGVKIADLIDHAEKNGIPVIGINDSGGARIQEGVASLAGYGKIFLKNVRTSGVIPQISIIAGPTAGGATYSPALTDFIFMIEEIGYMFITGPQVIKTVTGEDISQQDLGGPNIHLEKSGVAHFRAESEQDCFEKVKKLLSFIPSNNAERPARVESKDPYDRQTLTLRTVVPEDSKKAYDMREVITEVVDDGDFFEVQQEFAKTTIVGFARLGGYSIGLFANQPMCRSGLLDIDSSDKSARFVRFCDAFNIPIISFVDVPGFMPGIEQEYGGIIRHGAKLIYAYAEATVPKLTVITRKAYGGAYIVIGSKELASDYNIAWPTAEIAVMGPEGAVNILNRREIASAENEKSKHAELVEKYKMEFANPYQAAHLNLLDDVIDPADTRVVLIKALNNLINKIGTNTPARKHGNIPL